MFVIFDLDGTLAIDKHREHFLLLPEKDWDAYFDACDGDDPNRPILDVVNLFRQCNELSEKHRVEIWTGRNERVRDKTIAWLKAHDVSYDALRMRGADDFRKDTEVKGDWLASCRAEGRVPDIVFDDRNSVVNWWREQGITCCQVAEGDF